MDKIESFTGSYRFLSNFYPSPITIEGIEYPTVEHAYQAYKTTNVFERQMIAQAKTPGAAKRMGWRVRLRPDWETIKIHHMARCIYAKFKDPVLKQALIDTDPKYLIEGNTWGDVFWGVCNKRGRNMLGHILMSARLYFKNRE